MTSLLGAAHAVLQVAQAAAEREAEGLREERAKAINEAEEAAADAAAAHEASVAKLQAEADKAQVGRGLLGISCAQRFVQI